MDPIIYIFNIDLTKLFYTYKIVKYLRNKEDRVVILNRDTVKSIVIDI